MTCIPRAPRANCGIFIQEQIQIRFQTTKNFSEKIRIRELMVVGGKAIHIAFQVVPGLEKKAQLHFNVLCHSFGVLIPKKVDF